MAFAISPRGIPLKGSSGLARGIGHTSDASTSRAGNVAEVAMKYLFVDDHSFASGHRDYSERALKWCRSIQELPMSLSIFVLVIMMDCPSAFKCDR